MENECEALPGVDYPGVRDNRSTINTKTGYDDDMTMLHGWKDNSMLAKLLAACTYLSSIVSELYDG